MASFYRDPPYLNQMDKAFTTDQTRTRSVSSRFGNLTKATSNIVLPCSNDAIVDPLAKEIVNRLEVINRIVPQEEAIMISQDVINKLNAVCYEKLAEQFLPPNRGAASINGRCSVLTGNVTQKSTKPAPKNGYCGEQDIISKINNAAKQVQKENNLTTISEMSHGLVVPLSTDNSRRVNKSLKVISSYAENDVPHASHRPGPSTVRSQSRSQKIQSNYKIKRSKRSSFEDEDEYSITSAELTITKNSLRSNRVVSEKKTKAVTMRKNIIISPKEAVRKRMKNTAVKQKPKSGGFFGLLSEEDSIVDTSVQKLEDTEVERLRSLPKKTALSPFIKKLKKKRSINTSTPMKGMC